MTVKTSGPKIKCTVCGSVIQSMHRHDFRGCKCGAIAVDGGSEYLRIVGDAVWELVEEDNCRGMNSTTKTQT